MKRMRHTLPSGESQKPSTAVRPVWPVLAKDPRTLTSVKGLGASGPATFTATSTKSYASTLAADCENVTSLGTPNKADGSAKVNNNANSHLMRPNMLPSRFGRKGELNEMRSLHLDLVLIKLLFANRRFEGRGVLARRREPKESRFGVAFHRLSSSPAS